jgi:hypothetical protein
LECGGLRPPFLKTRLFTLFLARHFAGSDQSVLSDLRRFSPQAARAVAHSPEMAGLKSPFAAEKSHFHTMLKQRMRELAPHYIE